MKLGRFFHNKEVRWGQIDGRRVNLLAGEPFAGLKLTEKSIAINEVKLLPPAQPGKIVLLGLNYRDHARELKMKLPQEPIIFLKPPSAVIGCGQKINYPEGVRRLDYEAELAIVIGKTARLVRESEARNYILGFTCLNDVTARDLQKRDIQWTRAKSFDTFCPLGPWIETDLNPADLKIRTYLNGKLKQDSSTANFIFSVDYIISFISRIMTLFPGDIISTGTPSGVGRMERGDVVEVEIEGIGKLVNRVA